MKSIFPSLGHCVAVRPHCLITPQAAAALAREEAHLDAMLSG